GDWSGALCKMLKSFGWYPFPYRRSEVSSFLERPKRLSVILLRLFGLKRPYYSGVPASPTNDQVSPTPSGGGRPGASVEGGGGRGPRSRPPLRSALKAGRITVVRQS